MRVRIPRQDFTLEELIVPRVVHIVETMTIVSIIYIFNGMGEKVMIAHGYKKTIDATQFGMPSMEHQCILGSNIALKVVAIAQIP